KSDYQYSNNIVYNNFPWPRDVTDTRRDAVTAASATVLEVRTRYPDSRLSDLYDPVAMPAALVQAHNALDRAVDRCSRLAALPTVRSRVECLFAFYEELVTPLTPPTRVRQQRRARS